MGKQRSTKQTHKTKVRVTLFERHMFQDVTEFRVPKPSHVGIDPKFRCQIKVISCMGQNVFLS